jgi:hypothetical protein
MRIINSHYIFSLSSFFFNYFNKYISCDIAFYTIHVLLLKRVELFGTLVRKTKIKNIFFFAAHVAHELCHYVPILFFQKNLLSLNKTFLYFFL